MILLAGCLIEGRGVTRKGLWLKWRIGKGKLGICAESKMRKKKKKGPGRALTWL